MDWNDGKYYPAQNVQEVFEIGIFVEICQFGSRPRWKEVGFGIKHNVSIQYLSLKSSIAGYERRI